MRKSVLYSVLIKMVEATYERNSEKLRKFDSYFRREVGDNGSSLGHYGECRRNCILAMELVDCETWYNELKGDAVIALKKSENGQR